MSFILTSKAMISPSSFASTPKSLGRAEEHEEPGVCSVDNKSSKIG